MYVEYVLEWGTDKLICLPHHTQLLAPTSKPKTVNCKRKMKMKSGEKKKNEIEIESNRIAWNGIEFYLFSIFGGGSSNNKTTRGAKRLPRGCPKERHKTI